MRAISVRQPWAWAILHGKPVENRGKPWPLGEYALHASKLPAPAKDGTVPYTFMEQVWEARSMARRTGLDWTGILTYESLYATSGAIIGVIEVVDCVTSHSSPFFCGPIGLVLANVRPLAKPIPCKGALGAWAVPPEIERQVREQVR